MRRARSYDTLDWNISGNWGNDDKFQTSTKKLHMAGGEADSARHHRRRADNYNT